MLSLIVAAADNGVIGRDGGMPWHLPADLRWFAECTRGHPVIMGRRTHDAIGRPLPGRRNVVVSRDSSARASGCEQVDSLEAALALVDDGEHECFVIGGASIFVQALPMAHRLYLTRVHAHVPGDTYFQPSLSGWHERKTGEHDADATHAHAMSFWVLERSG